MAKKSKGADYGVENIKTLKGLEKVRKKPGMYMGERGPMMVFRQVKELADNVYDEFAAGRNKCLEIVLDLKNNSYIVADKAGGVPVGVNKGDGDGRNTMELIFTELHAGGKFDDTAYKTSAGTHGVGAAASNALAETFEVYSNWKKQLWMQTYEKGIPTCKVKKCKAVPKEIMALLSSKKGYGTIIRFTPDQTIVSADATNKKAKKLTTATLDMKQIVTWSHNMAMMNPGFIITVGLLKKGKLKSKVYHNKKDLGLVVAEMAKENEWTTLGRKPMIVDEGPVKCALQWSSYEENDQFHTYVSCSPTRDHGKHFDGLFAALSRVLQTASKADAPAKKSIVKTKARAKKTASNAFKGRDALYGMIGFLNFNMSDAEFSSQTKDRLTSHVDKDVEAIMFKAFTEYFEEYPTLVKQIIKRAIAISAGREKLKSVMKSVSEVRQSSKSMMLPNILSAADKARPEEREIYIVEGDSAGGTAKNARNSDFQEVFKLRGKLTNSSRTDMTSLLSSQVVQNMLVAFGVDLRTLDLDAENLSTVTFSTEKLRIGTVMFLCDADTDGLHITVLLMSAIQRLLPTLYDEGRIFICLSPLFITTYKDKLYHGMTMEEVQAKLPKGANAHITRAKGLGELNADDLREVAFDTNNRHLIQVNPPKGLEGLQYFHDITGSNSHARKELLGLA